MPSFGRASLAHLAGVDPELQKVFNEVIKHWDCQITDGDRTVEEQRANIRKGVSQTMNSKHIGGHAVDAHPYPINWDNVQRGLDTLVALDKKGKGGTDVLEFYMFIGFVLGIATKMGVKLRVGADWNGNRQVDDQSFHDLPHFELAD